MSPPPNRFRGPPPLSADDRKFESAQQYLDGKTIRRDEELEATLGRCREEDLPAIAVSQSQGVVSCFAAVLTGQDDGHIDQVYERQARA